MIHRFTPVRPGCYHPGATAYAGAQFCTTRIDVFVPIVRPHVNPVRDVEWVQAYQRLPFSEKAGALSQTTMPAFTYTTPSQKYRAVPNLCSITGSTV